MIKLMEYLLDTWTIYHQLQYQILKPAIMPARQCHGLFPTATHELIAIIYSKLYILQYFKKNESTKFIPYIQLQIEAEFRL